MRALSSLNQRFLDLGRLRLHQQAQSLATAATVDSEATPNNPGRTPMYAACVLERLPIVLSKPKQWEFQYESWVTEKKLKQGLLKEYPQLGDKEESSASSQQQVEGGQKLKEFSLVPTKTSSEGNTRSMKRHLEQRLYFVVKDKESGEWRFPHALHEMGESIRDTAERAMLNTVGRRYPIFFIGNAPIAHLQLSSSGGTVYHMLAQAVDDPWETKLLPESGADDHAWVTKDEITSEYTKDPRVRELLAKML